MRLSSTLFADTPEETAARGAALVDQGYTAVKFGWGPMGESAEVDLALVQQARAGVGPDVSLLVDAACVWPDARTALARAKAFEPYDLFLLEEPLHPDDMEGCACSRQHLYFQVDLDRSIADLQLPCQETYLMNTCGGQIHVAPGPIAGADSRRRE